MQVSEFLEVLNHIKDVFEGSKIQDLYTELGARFDPNRSRARSQQVGDYEDIRLKIEALHKKMHPKQWGKMKWDIFRKLGADKIIGEHALEQLNGFLGRKGLQQSAAFEEVQRISDSMTKLKEDVYILIGRLAGLEDEAVAGSEQDLKKGEAILNIYYDQNSPVHTINSVIEHVGMWQKIIESFAKLVSESSLEARLLTLEKSPSLILALVTHVNVVHAIAKATHQVLTIRLSALKIRNLRVETQKVELADKLTIIKELEKTFQAAESASTREGFDKIKLSLLKDYGWGDEPEVSMIADGIANSLNDIYKFIEVGGHISVAQKGNPMTENIQKELSESFNKIRELESKIALIKEEAGGD